MRIVSISDTHGSEPDLLPGDLLIHSGDFTKYGFRSEAIRQLCWLEEQRSKFKNVIVIPGNHDHYFERHPEQAREACLEAGLILLINEWVMIDGLKVYGSPITPTYHDWAFNVLPGSPIAEAWEKIPLDTDVLITHGPPKGILDKNSRDELLGCPELLRKVKEIKPKLHTFGHVHEGYGFVDIDGIRYVNAAIGEQGLKPSIITDI